MNSENTKNHDRRSFLKAVGVGGLSISVASGQSVAQAGDSSKTTSKKSVELVQMNLEHQVSTSNTDGLTLAEFYGDRFTQYSIQDDTLIVSSEEAENRLSFENLVVSPQNFGSKSFQSASGPISPTGGSNYLTTEMTESLSPTKAVQVETPQEFGKATVSRSVDNVLEVGYRGETTTVGPKSHEKIETSATTVPVEMKSESSGDRTFEPASVTPVLHVKNHGELDYHSKV